SWFEGSPEARLERVALRGSSMQTAYLIMAARSLGLDTGPMTGFDNAQVDEAFLKGTPIRSNVRVNVGQSEPASVYPRSLRLSSDEAARLESAHPRPCGRRPAATRGCSPHAAAPRGRARHPLPPTASRGTSMHIPPRPLLPLALT